MPSVSLTKVTLSSHRGNRVAGRTATIAPASGRFGFGSSHPVP